MYNLQDKTFNVSKTMKSIEIGEVSSSNFNLDNLLQCLAVKKSLNSFFIFLQIFFLLIFSSLFPFLNTFPNRLRLVISFS